MMFFQRNVYSIHIYVLVKTCFEFNRYFCNTSFHKPKDTKGSLFINTNLIILPFLFNRFISSLRMAQLLKR